MNLIGRKLPGCLRQPVIELHPRSSPLNLFRGAAPRLQLSQRATQVVRAAAGAESGIYVSSGFDSGNGQLVSAKDAASIQIKLKPDPYTAGDRRSHMQTFFFRLSGNVKNTPVTMHIINAKDTTYPEAYKRVKVRRSYDLENWTLVDTAYCDETGVLKINDTPACSIAYYAMWPPYTVARGEEYQQRVAAAYPDLVTQEVMGESVQGRPLDLLIVGKRPFDGKKRIWLQARNHPGESQSGYFLEGLVNALLDHNYPHYAGDAASQLLDDAVFYLAWNINPDGTYLGHLRTNANGANMNREWERPSALYSPEVVHTLAKLDEIGGPSLFFDLHADWGIPYNWLWWPRNGVTTWTDGFDHIVDLFDGTWKSGQPAYQTAVNYAPAPPGKAPLYHACSTVATRFGTVAGTLEQTFTDIVYYPDETQQWSPQRAQQFGASILHPIAKVLPLLPLPDGAKERELPKLGYTDEWIGLPEE